MNQTARIDDFIDQLTFKFGPDELLARFSFKIANAAAQRGVFLEFSTFSELLEVNKANADSWMPLTTSFQAQNGGADAENGLVLLGRNTSGEVVATQAVRLFDWTATNFKTEAESLRFFYADPERDKAPGEHCVVTAPNAAAVTGRVALGGGIWYRPDYRRLQLGEIIPRFARAYAYALWEYDCLIATVTQKNIGKTFGKKLGFQDVTPNSMVMHNSPTVPDGDLHLGLAIMKPMQLVDDVFMFLADFDLAADAVVDQRRA